MNHQPSIRVLTGNSTPEIHTYAVAGAEVCVDRQLPALAAFFCRKTREEPRNPGIFPAGPASLVYSGDAFVMGTYRRLSCELLDETYQIEIEQFGRCVLDPGSATLKLPQATPDQIARALCGPLLPLALAHFGCFLLHASAVTHKSHLIALAGASGSGKSTLAAACARKLRETLCADDALPLRRHKSQIQVPGAYPQPKWERWLGTVFPTPVELKAVVELCNDGRDTSLERYSTSSAALALLRHSVAARLFSPALMRTHLAFAAAMAESIPVYGLHYRQELSNLDEMIEKVRQVVE